MRRAHLLDVLRRGKRLLLMIHHYLITHDTDLDEWSMDGETESELFREGTIYDPAAQTWSRSYIGDEDFAPNEERLSEALTVAVGYLNRSALAVLYTGCQLCDHEAEFYGVVLDDVAHFPCGNCREVFTIGNIGGWSSFFEDDDYD
jgi:hypothetical protein